MPDEEILAGGVANAGAVVRVGDEVLRPRGPHAAAIGGLLRHVRAAGLAGVPEPLGPASGGRERFGYIAGDVPVPPFPAWARSDTALASIAALLRRYHDAAAGFAAVDGATWSDELADPRGGALVCHNDVCLENVVFRDGTAVALLDFDFAAPGRALWDVATFARMCVPLDLPEYAALAHLDGLDPFARLRVAADGYGLAAAERAGLVDVIGEGMARGGAFVRARVERGEAAFIAMWERYGGQERYDRRRDWFERERPRFAAALA